MLLEKLTPEQEQLMYEHREDCIDFIVNNGKHQPKDLELTSQLREDINWVYKKANLKPPKFVFIAKSYYEEKLMINTVFQMFKEGFMSRNQVYDQVESQVYDQVESQVYDQVESQVRGQVESQVRGQVESQVRGQVRSQVYDQVRSQVYDQVRNQVSDQVRNQVSDQVSDQVRGQVWSQVRNQVWNQVSDQVRGQVWSQVRNQVSDQVSDQVYDQVRSQVWSQVCGQKLEWIEQSFGLPWNSWFSFYTYFRMLDIVKSPDFDRYFGLIKNYGLWSIQFFENWCIVTQLPKIIRRDDKTRLHSSDSPTIEWRNGQKDYWIHGIYIPKIEEWEHIVSGNMSFKEIMQESNQEKRRAILEEIGSDKLFDLIPKQYVKLLSSERGYNLYNISKQVFNDDKLIEDMRLLTYSCPSTNRKYADTVPIIDQERNIELNTAMDAIAWKFHKTRKEYIELLRIES